MRSSSLTPPTAEKTSPQIRVIKTIDDPFKGLKGHAYIKARNLNTPVKRLVQTSAQMPCHMPPPKTGSLRVVLDSLFPDVMVSK